MNVRRGDTAPAALRRLVRATGLHLVRRAVLRHRLERQGCRVRNDAGRNLYVRADDPRAHDLFRCHGAVDRDAVWLWNTLIREVEPTVALDVGANYGEVGLSTDYSGTSVRRLYLVEANPDIAAQLEQSVAEAVAGAAMPSVRLHRVAASDATGVACLHLDDRSSGLSSLVPTGGPSREVPKARLDDLLADERGSRVLFKIDVEGHERAVLAGMGDLLLDAVGICEAIHLGEEDLHFLVDNFAVEIVRRDHTTRRASLQELTDAMAEPGEVMKDVVLRPKARS